MSTRRLGWLAVLAGGGLAMAVQIAAPVGVPLYDGVVVQEPYRFLHPTGDQAGNPTTFASEPQVTGGVSPTIVAATQESPPQAQFIAQIGAFEVAPAIASLRVAIDVVEPPAVPPPGAIAGNVYRFIVTDAAGTPLEIRACEGCATLVLRAPEGTGTATLARFAGGTWTVVPTIHAGLVASYSTNPTALGDYAVLATGPVSQDALDPTLLIAGAAVALIGLAAAGLLLMRRRAAPEPAPAPRHDAGSVPPRVPSKRRRPRPPSEGS